MRREAIGICPMCQNKLLATRLSCPACHTEITGEFELSRFSNLDRDELKFIETFVILRGNIKDMEKELEISYPTVKKYLDNIIQKMGYPVKPAVEVDKEAVLKQIWNKELSVEEAIEILKGK